MGGESNLIVFPDLMEGILARKINPLFPLPRVPAGNHPIPAREPANDTGISLLDHHNTSLLNSCTPIILPVGPIAPSLS